MLGKSLALAFLGLVLLGSCADDKGAIVTIKVGATDTKYIELFVGEDRCTNAAGTRCDMQWMTEHAMPVSTDQSFTRKRASKFVHEVVDGQVTFLLKPEDADAAHTVLAMAAVGYSDASYDWQHITGAVVIPTNFDPSDPSLFVNTLHKTAGYTGPTFNMDDLQVDVWEQSAPLPSSDEAERCVAIAADLTGGPAIVIVPEDDHDCDDRPVENACFAQTPVTTPSDSQRHCIEIHQGKCNYGQQTCDPATGDETACDGLKYVDNHGDGGIPCFPETACDDDRSNDCMQSPETCPADLLDQFGADDFYDSCTIYWGLAMGNNSSALCQNTDMTIRLPLPPGPSANPICDTAHIAKLQAGTLQFDSSVLLTDSPIYTAKLHVDVDRDTCVVTLTADGDPFDANLAPSPPVTRVIVRVDLMNDFSLWLPIELNYMQGPTTGTCDGLNASFCGSAKTEDPSLTACVSHSPT